MNLKQAVVFAILMQSGQGIIGKSPDYVLEKLRLCEHLTEEYLFSPLDSHNREKLYEYQARWLRGESNEEV